MIVKVLNLTTNLISLDLKTQDINQIFATYRDFKFKLTKLKLSLFYDVYSYLNEKVFLAFLKSQKETHREVEISGYLASIKVQSCIVNEIPNLTTLRLDNLD